MSDHLGGGEVVVTRPVAAIVGVVFMGVVGYVGVTVERTSTEVAVLSERVSALQLSVDRLTGRSDNQYSAAEADRDWAHQRAINEELRRRIRALEQPHPSTRSGVR